MATIWIPPSTMNTPAWMAMARIVIRIDARSHAANASRLMPAEQRAAPLHRAGRSGALRFGQSYVPARAGS